MADFHQSESLEEQLREQQRMASALRRRRRMRWLIPLILLLLLLAGLYIYLRISYDQEHPEETTAPPSDSTATVVAVGDINFTGKLLNSCRRGDGYDFSDCFSRVLPQLASADLTVGNLEANAADQGADRVCPPEFLQALADSGFDVLQTANSYSIQNGITGLTRTCAAVRKAGMDPVGTFSSAQEREQCGGVTIREANGIRFAFVGLTKGLNNLRIPEGAEYSVNLLYTDYDTNYSSIAKDSILQLMENAKAQDPDVIIVMVHWGSEYTDGITDTQKRIAELLFDNGADVVLGSHSHLVGQMQKHSVSTLLGTREEGFIAYSLGDFLSAADEPDAQFGCMLKLEFSKKGGETTLTGVSYTPTYSSKPSSELETRRYAVYDTLDAIRLYEQGYYDRVSETLFKRMKDALEDLRKQTDSDFQRVDEIPEETGS